MKPYTIYDTETGKILRTGLASDISYHFKAKDGEGILEGLANDLTQKVVVDAVAGLGWTLPIKKVIDKTSAEIEASKLPEPKLLPVEKQQAYITNEQLQTILDRLAALEEEKLPLEL